MVFDKEAKMCSKRNALIFLVVVIGCRSIEAVLNFEDENFFGHEADRYDWKKHPCRRNCSENEKPRTCRYVFVVERFSSMSKACYDCPFNITDCYRPHCVPADGFQKTVYTVNRQLPGPQIEVCQNDIIEVEVRNMMLSESTTVHWHGIKQTTTAHYDGVPFVTQCPILPGERFRYIFNATSTGTSFWHSHIGMQRADGMFGALIVHPTPNNNVHAKLYDYDNLNMIILDWMQMGADDGLVKTYYDQPNVLPTTILVNGLGRYRQFKRNGTTTYVPPAVFKVIKNKRFRFRLIDSGSEGCPIEMFIDNHTMLVISLDSKDIVPVEVDAITIWPGERVDFVLKANQKIDNYWIRFRGYDLCTGSSTYKSSTNGAYQVAILRYAGAKIQNPKGKIGYEIPKHTNTTRVLNPYNKGTEDESPININIPSLNATDPNDPALTDKVDHQVYIAFDFYPIDNYDFHRKNLYGYNQVANNRRIGSFQLNHISLKMPSFPLLSQWKMIQPNTLCNSTTIPKNCKKEQCACTHVLHFKLNSIVELVFVDQGSIEVINHPLHLHGHFFRVISTVNLEGLVTIERVKKLDREGKIKRRLDRAPIKDTIKAPGGGYTIVRFHADNPGYWLFHCHFDQHMNVGMALIIKVGEHEEFHPIPKDFPKCGSYTPNTM